GLRIWHVRSRTSFWLAEHADGGIAAMNAWRKVGRCGAAVAQERLGEQKSAHQLPATGPGPRAAGVQPEMVRRASRRYRH
ncbi:MAG TPA: hypothetical protein VFZ10_09960, partial [Geminicoccaceae bacterium]